MDAAEIYSLQQIVAKTLREPQKRGKSGENQASDEQARAKRRESGGLARRQEEAGELAELGPAEVPELVPVGIADRLIKSREQREARRCNTDKDFAAIRILAAAADETALFEPVEEAGDVRVAGDHAIADFAAEQTLGCAAENAEDVVLVGGELVLFEELGRSAGEQIGGAHQFDKDGFFRTRGMFARSGRDAGHTYQDGRCNG